jgi:hypothetical protein
LRSRVGRGVVSYIPFRSEKRFCYYISKRFFFGTSIADTVHTVYSAMLSFPSRLHCAVPALQIYVAERGGGPGGKGGIFALASLNCACISLEGRVKGERNRCYYFSVKMQKLTAKNQKDHIKIGSCICWRCMKVHC